MGNIHHIMRHSFLLSAIAFLTAGATEAQAATGAAVIAQKVYTSDKLTALRAARKVEAGKLNAIEDTESEDYAKQFDIVFKADQEIKAEIANLKQAEREAEIQEKRAAKVSLFDTCITAWDANTAAQADKKMSLEDKNAVYDAYKTAREVVVNMLLGTVAKPATASTGTAGASTGTAGANAEAIVALFLAGETLAQIEAKGYAKSTVWHAVNNYKIAQGLKPAKG